MYPMYKSSLFRWPLSRKLNELPELFASVSKASNHPSFSIWRKSPSPNIVDRIITNPLPQLNRPAGCRARNSCHMCQSSSRFDRRVHSTCTNLCITELKIFSCSFSSNDRKALSCFAESISSLNLILSSFPAFFAISWKVDSESSCDVELQAMIDDR